MKSSRSFYGLIFGICALIIFNCILFFRAHFSSRPYNLLIVSIDTLRADHMGVYGYPKQTTPNIDAWARDAFVFQNAYTLTPVTYPSFSMLMTGVNPYESSIYNNGTTEMVGDRRVVLVNKGNPKIPTDRVTLTEILKTKGYTTAGFVANPVLSPEFTNISKGFSEYKTYSKIQEGIDPNQQAVQDGVDWLDTHANNSSPFFLWVHVLDPHSPYTQPSDLACQFNQDYCDEIKRKGYEKLEEERVQLSGCKRSAIPEPSVELYQTLYDGEVAYSDRLIGTVLQTIQQKRLDKDTVVLFYSDHGEGFDHNYYFEHGKTLYNSSVSIPFLLTIPGKKGRHIETAIDSTQILSTLLDILHIPYTEIKRQIPPSMAYLFNPSAPIPDQSPMYFLNSQGTKFGLLDGNYKYIYSLHDDCFVTEDELYDLSVDNQELKNIASSHPQIVNIMKQAVLTYAKAHGFLQKAEMPEQKSTTQDSGEILEQIRKLGY